MWLERFAGPMPPTLHRCHECQCLRPLEHATPERWLEGLSCIVMEDPGLHSCNWSPMSERITLGLELLSELGDTWKFSEHTAQHENKAIQKKDLHARTDRIANSFEINFKSYA